MKGTKTSTNTISSSTVVEVNYALKTTSGKEVKGCFRVKTEGKNFDDVECWDGAEMTYSLQYPGYTVQCSTRRKDRVMMQEIDEVVNDLGLYTQEQIEAWKKTCATITRMP